jgi:hypothetical protein
MAQRESDSDEIYRELFDWLSSSSSAYGNHSCDACTVSNDCPLRDFVGNTSTPNSCSFYWPPNADREPGEWYWEQLNLIAEETIKARVEAALKRDGVIIIETGDMS